MATDGKSRIPKFSFGFRRTKVQDEPSSPSPDPPSIIRSATPTNPPASRSAESSPKVSRSKSLRLPRPTKYGLKSHSQSSITESNQNGYNGDNDLVPDVKSVKLNISRNSLSPRGRSLTVSGHMSSSSNQSSRSNSPSVSVSTGAGTEKRKLVPKSEAVQSSSQADEDAQLERFQRRTQSFHTTRQPNHTRSDSLGNGEKLAAPQFARNHSSRRAKTPTSSYKSTSNGLQMKKSSVGGSGGSVGGSGDKMPITRTTSLGKVNRIQRVEEGTPTSKPSSRRFSSEPRGKRPSSMVGRNNTPDLNTLAHEMTSNDQSESRISRPPSSKIPPPLRSRRSQSALDHHPHAYTRHTPSPTGTEAVTSTTASQASGSNSSNEGPGVKSYEQPTIASAAKSSRPNSSNSQYKMSRQGSFGSQSNLSSASGDSHKYELNKKKSVTNLDSVDGGGSGRATPTGGRGTPIVRKKGRDSLDSSTVTSTTGRLASGLPPRTPYRVARTMIPPSSGAAGINELEGSVLLEADDYLRVCHDVKALKTSLLRLKREIQTDSSSPLATGVGGNSRVGRSRPSHNTDASGSTLTDLKKKLKQVTSERDKALEEVGSLKKENTSLSSKVTVLTSGLSTLKDTHSKLEVESRQIEGHRDMLLDKVERLHADNHKLEDRLMSYEKASIYEQTISESWLDELDGDDSLADIEEDEMEYEGQTSEANEHIT